MDREPFEEKMRRMLYQNPFSPFEVEKENGENGELIVVDQRFAMGGGMIGYITPDARLVEIKHEEVKAIRP